MQTTVSNQLKSESLELLREYQHSPSNSIRNQLVQINIGLVRKEVHHWLNQCTESYDDLLQVGCIGLIRAIERFDMSKGHAFSSFAIPYIRGEIQHYLRDKSPSVRVPRQWLTLLRKATPCIQELQVKLGRKPTDVEIASALEISVEEWNQVKLASQNRSLLSLDAPIQDEEEGSTSLGDLVPDTRYRSFQLAQEDQIRLQQALGHLEDGTRKVLEFVFLYDLTQKETAEKLGISAVTVSRRVKRGLSLLKTMMNGPSDSDR
ncbi:MULTISPECIES: RNA polymerase sigma factor SigF [Arthrospira]|jgi:RNA polymerase sigma-B factor|uniref:Group 3 RNA polymerase sigma factor SigF n=1 Tax=Limnospira platensis NIES-46 TaxID=1236695 RepID=A0A5M3T7W8_LIMPL|nr:MULTISPECIES: RNA polymerase sigma factor SigF [Arthrospira]AMW28154.1 RNA polymerase subunit sigma [Arthrospira platensis YZ]KDR58208.1 RNA polymerase sigma factor SigF [Arthrospira platensis str. Paraca]MBD2668350.1 RNA polymerase sigma factor SigF [Arthrospira platensis FACHB-439]MBD2710016.1 RNA polymerase sigma factor SigF [Arthrospira platensis FACHB-835]MDF2209285.1 RNA polymerase sigma factor SigF [Arthrospira platensis NCB002]MDT9184968.1 RNA polymerase sigma factor SigF [Limnospi